MSLTVQKWPHQTLTFSEHKFTIKVKLSGDGTNIGYEVTRAFTVLNEGAAAYTSEGNYPMAIFKEAEDYESLKRALADIVNKVSKLLMIEIDWNTNNVRYYLGGDKKFLALVTGTTLLAHTHASGANFHQLIILMLTSHVHN